MSKNPRQEIKTQHQGPWSEEIKTQHLEDIKTQWQMSKNPRYEIDTHHVEDHLGKMEEIKTPHLEEIKTPHLEEIKTQHLEEIKTQHLEEIKTQHLEEIKTQHLQEIKPNTRGRGIDLPVTSTNIESTRQPMTDLDWWKFQVISGQIQWRGRSWVFTNRIQGSDNPVQGL